MRWRSARCELLAREAPPIADGHLRQIKQFVYGEIRIVWGHRVLPSGNRTNFDEVFFEWMDFSFPFCRLPSGKKLSWCEAIVFLLRREGKDQLAALFQNERFYTACCTVNFDFSRSFWFIHSMRFLTKRTWFSDGKRKSIHSGNKLPHSWP